jgi:hypothetical protein
MSDICKNKKMMEIFEKTRKTEGETWFDHIRREGIRRQPDVQEIR